MPERDIDEILIWPGVISSAAVVIALQAGVLRDLVRLLAVAFAVGEGFLRVADARVAGLGRAGGEEQAERERDAGARRNMDGMHGCSSLVVAGRHASRSPTLQ